MALVVCWYDFVCFAIVGGAIIGSLWVLRQKEGAGKRDNDTKYESLLVHGSDGNEFLGLTRSGHVSSSQLWMSCWNGVRHGLSLPSSWPGSWRGTSLTMTQASSYTTQSKDQQFTS